MCGDFQWHCERVGAGHSRCNIDSCCFHLQVIATHGDLCRAHQHRDITADGNDRSINKATPFNLSNAVAFPQRDVLENDVG